MKKIYLSFCSLLVLGALNAQTTYSKASAKTGAFSKIPGGKIIPSSVVRDKSTFFSNDFSTPANWSTGNNSGNSDNWVVGTAVPSGVFPLDPIVSTTAANGYALFDSDLLCSGDQSAYVQLISPINCSGHTSVAIEFEQYFRMWQCQTFVQVSTNGTSWTDFELNQSYVANDFSANPELVTMNISSVAANQATVYIRFYYLSGPGNGFDGCGYSWMVDDVSLRDLDNYDLTAMSAYWGTTGNWGARLPYSMVPSSQVEPIDYAVSVMNNGVLTQTDVALTANIPEASFTNTGAQITLASGQTDTASLSMSFTPGLTSMTYNPTLSIGSSNADALPLDNILTGIPVTVNDSIYARDMNVVDGGSFNSGNGYEAGNVFDVYTDAVATSASVLIGATTNPGSQVYVRIYSLDAGGNFVFEAESDLLTINNSDLGNIVSIPFQSPVSLIADSSYIVVAGSYGDAGASNDLVVGTSGISEVLTSFYLDMTDQTWYYTTATPMVRLNVPADLPLVTSTDADNMICAGQTITLTSSSATGNVWSPGGETTQSIVVSASGIYSVTVSGNTSLTTTVTVNPLPPMPTITAGGSTTICPGGSVMLSSSAANGNVWSVNGETTQSITASAAGNYSVTVTSAGCSTTSVVTNVVMATSPAIASGALVNPSACGLLDGSAAVSGTGGMGTISWTGSASGNMAGVTLPNMITGLGAGIYNVTFNDGCISNTIAVTLNDPGAIPTISAGSSTTFCQGDQVVLTSSSASGNVWTPNGETTQSITVNSAGTYYVSVTSGACVTSSNGTSVTVNAVPSAPSITPSGATTFCQGGSVDLVSSSGFGPIWSTAETTQLITVSTSGIFTVTATVGGCTSAPSASVTVTVNTNPTVTLGAFNPICNTGSSFALNQGSPAGGTYTVNGTLAVNFDPATATIGSNTIVYDFTDGNGCSGSATSNITVDDCTALSESQQDLFQVYPNPATSVVTISGERMIEVSGIALYDELGRMVQAYPVTLKEVVLDLSSYSTGIYTLKIKGNSFEEIQKIQLIN